MVETLFISRTFIAAFHGCFLLPATYKYIALRYIAFDSGDRDVGLSTLVTSINWLPVNGLFHLTAVLRSSVA